MKNKQALIGIVAAVIILVGAGGVFLLGKNKTNPESNSTTATQNVREDSKMTSDLASLIKSGKTQQCNFSYDDQKGTKTTGMTYISGDKMRTDLNSSVNGKSSTIYVVRNGDENFIWGSEFPENTGMKMTMSVDDVASNENSKQYFDPNMKANYDCKGWSLDATVFTPPTNVKFQDFSSLIQGVMKKVSGSPTGSTKNTTSECGICNSLTGEAKDACVKQFSC